MKSIIFIVLTLVVLVNLVVGCCGTNAQVDFADMKSEMHKKPSDYDTGETLEDAFKQTKPIVVKFYADWCGACRRAAPVFESVKQDYKDKAEFVMVDVDKHKDLSDEYNVMFLPTIFIMNPKTRDKEQMPGGSAYDKDEFIQSLDELLPKYK